jgi:microcystin-dependent protein
MTVTPNPGTLWPDDFQGCTIVGQYLDLAGHAVVGSLTFTMSPTAVLDAANNLVIVPKVFSVALDSVGSFTITLPATDDPDINPMDWTYAVSENFVGGRKYGIRAPQNQIVNLVDIAPVPASQGEAIVRGPRGQAGGVQYVNGHTGDVVTLTAADVGADPGGAAAAATATALQKTSNLGDVADAPTSRINLGLGTIATHSDTDYLVAALLDAICPIGEVRMWLSDTEPSTTTPEWQICDGTAISRTTYSQLFSLIGTTHGVGNGTTTFNLPDLRGRYPVGSGAGAIGALASKNSLTSYLHSHNLTNGYAMLAMNLNQVMMKRVDAQNPNSYSSTLAIRGTSDDPNISPNANGVQLGGSADSDGHLVPYLAVNFIVRAR